MFCFFLLHSIMLLLRVFKTNFTRVKRHFTLMKGGSNSNETKFCYRKNNSKQHKILLRNISKIFHRYSTVSSSSFENSCDDGKWPLGCVQCGFRVRHVRHTERVQPLTAWFRVRYETKFLTKEVYSKQNQNKAILHGYETKF